MKKIIAFTLMLLITDTLFSQQTTPSTVLTKQDYLKKSKNKKTAAWVLLGGGTAFTIIGLANAMNGVENSLYGINLTTGQVDENITSGSIFFITGAAAILGSIPFFISSGKNKRKAISMSIKNELAPQQLNRNFVYKSIPSLTLNISL